MSDRDGPQGPAQRSDPAQPSSPGPRPGDGDRVAPGDEGQGAGGPREGGDQQAGRTGVTRPGDGRSARQPGIALASQRMADPPAEPPGPPSRTGIFVELPALRAHVGRVIASRFGGRTFDEAPPEVQDATHAPAPHASGYLRPTVLGRSLGSAVTGRVGRWGMVVLAPSGRSAGGGVRRVTRCVGQPQEPATLPLGHPTPDAEVDA